MLATEMTDARHFVDLQMDGTKSVELKSAEDSYCEVTHAQVVHAIVNPNLLSPESDEVGIKLVQGDRIRVDFGTGGSDAHISERSVFLGRGIVSGIAKVLDPSLVGELVCQTMEDFCPAVFDENGFSTIDDCTAAMAMLPMTTPSVTEGMATLDGNSLGCRHLHAMLARTSPEVHCNHLSVSPIEDINGATKCQVSYNHTYEEFFDPSDLASFDLAAARGGLGETQLATNVPTDAKEECIAAGSSDDIATSLGLPADYFCYSYLETQKATAEDSVIAYWLALLGMLCIFRGLSIYSLKQKGTL